MAITPLPFLDRTAATFKADTDRFFGEELPTFSVEMNGVIGSVEASAAAALTSKNAAASSASTASTASSSAVTAANAAVPAAATATTKAAEAVTSASTAATKASEASASAQRAEDAAAGIGSGVVTSVNGKTPTSGNVTLLKADLALGNVDNTADINKPVSNPQLAAMHATALLF